MYNQEYIKPIQACKQNELEQMPYTGYFYHVLAC
jgi:hypothetical protein